MSNIPKAREMLKKFSTKLPDPQRLALLHIVHTYLYREPNVRRPPRKSRAVTTAVRTQIFALAQTDMHVSEIANQLGVNPGRVSEVLNGKR